MTGQQFLNGRSPSGVARPQVVEHDVQDLLFVSRHTQGFERHGAFSGRSSAISEGNGDVRPLLKRPNQGTYPPRRKKAASADKDGKRRRRMRAGGVF
jgi:hypothetical protein